MIFIKYVCRVPLRMSIEDMEIGDYAIHGEEPYTFAYYNRNYRQAVGYGHSGPTDEERAITAVRKSHDVGGSSNSGGGPEGVILGQEPDKAIREDLVGGGVKDGKQE